MKKRKNKESQKNSAAIIAFILILVSGFIFPLVEYNFFGTAVSNSKTIMLNLFLDFTKGTMPLGQDYNIAILFMMIIYVAVLLLYLLNGIGKIPNKYSKYASVLSFIYLGLGLLVIQLINNSYSIAILGFQVSSVVTGSGIYIIPIVGLLYLIFNKKINSAI